jgi:hypothetical protein
MGDMSGGFWRWLRGGEKRGASTRPAASSTEPAPGADDIDGTEDTDDTDESELHACCMCGALLGFDREDEIDGEGPGRDICGSCNRSRNDDSLMMGW